MNRGPVIIVAGEGALGLSAALSLAEAGCGWRLAPLVAETVTACVMGGESGPYAARLDPARVPVS